MKTRLLLFAALAALLAPSPASSQDATRLSVGRPETRELETFYTVALDDRKLTLSQRRDRDLGLSPKEKDAFTCGQWYVGDVRFGRDPDGHVASMTISNDRVRNLRFDRVAD